MCVGGGGGGGRFHDSGTLQRVVEDSWGVAAAAECRGGPPTSRRVDVPVWARRTKPPPPPPPPSVRHPSSPRTDMAEAKQNDWKRMPHQTTKRSSHATSVRCAAGAYGPEVRSPGHEGRPPWIRPPSGGV